MRIIDAKEIRVSEVVRQTTRLILFEPYNLGQRPTDFVHNLLNEYSRVGTFDRIQAYELAPRLQERLNPLAQILDGRFEGVRILDLGCGAIAGTHETSLYRDGLFEPWVARTLLKLGTDVTGIDVGDLSGEKFRAVQADLLIPGALNPLPEDYFDLVISNQLYTSPELQKKVEGKLGPGSIEAGARLFKMLVPQIRRVTKRNGDYLLHENFDYLSIEHTDALLRLGLRHAA